MVVYWNWRFRCVNFLGFICLILNVFLYIIDGEFFFDFNVFKRVWIFLVWSIFDKLGDFINWWNCVRVIV